MLITNKEMQSKVQVLNNISNKQLPVRSSYAIAKNIETINNELKIFEKEKMKIINEYAEKDENGENKILNNRFVFKQDTEDECNKKYNELLDIETEINIRKININDLIDSNVNFTPSELVDLDFMITE